MPALKLSILDQSPIISGHTPAQAIAETIKLAQVAEQLGYYRYWLAEHHALAALADPCPEILVARIAAVTSTLRVGTGGILLPHYSPLKVAEQFRMLEALYPGRIDLGVGRAPGGDRATAMAMGEGRYSGAEHSDYSGALAAQLGLRFAFAHFISADDGADVMRAYKQNFQPSQRESQPHALLAVFVICAESDAEAERLAASIDLRRLNSDYGRNLPVPSQQEAEAYHYNATEKARVTYNRRRAILGAPDTVKARLLELREKFDADELMVITITGDYATRLESYKLIAGVFGLCHPT